MKKKYERNEPGWKKSGIVQATVLSYTKGNVAGDSLDMERKEMGKGKGEAKGNERMALRKKLEFGHVSH